MIALLVCKQRQKMKWNDESIFQLTEQYEKNSGYNVIIPKILKIGIILCFFFFRYHLLAKCVIVSGTRQPAPETGTRNWPMCHQLKSIYFVTVLLLLLHS